MLGAVGNGTSEVVAIEAALGENPDAPAFLATNYTGTLDLLGLPLLDAIGGESAAVVKTSMDASGARVTDWQATITAVSGVRLTGLAVSPDSGDIVVCGIANGAPGFYNAGSILTLPPLSLGSARGFVARLNPATGKWKSSFTTSGLLPDGIAAGLGGSVFVTASNYIAAAYSSSGAQIWKTSSPSGFSANTRIATSLDAVYVLSRKNNAEKQVILSQISQANGAIIWSQGFGSDGNDFPGDIAVGPAGDISLCYYCDPSSSISHGRVFATQVDSSGSPIWQVQVGTGTSGSSMRAEAIDIDPTGNIWVAVQLDGYWTFPDLNPELFEDDAAVVALDRTGVLYDIHHTSGDGNESPEAICATYQGSVILGGTRSGSGNALLGDLLLPLSEKTSLFLSTLTEPLDQKLWIFRKDPEHPGLLDLWLIRRLLRGIGVPIYLEVNNGANGSAISGYATPAQVALMGIIQGIIAEPEVEFGTNSVKTRRVENAGWALARLANASDSSTSKDSVAADVPMTQDAVRLYLIDTAVKHTNTWFAQNPNLRNDGTILVRGSGDATKSSQFEHGTRMLSLIAGPETGAAIETPIQLLNYDVYPSGGSTTSGLIANAVMSAVKHYRANANGAPAVICLASGSSSEGDSAIIRYALESAINEGITVVISAGNIGEDASAYVPSRYGVNEGVICAGASGYSNERISISNHGAAVDLLAPGNAVRTVHFDDPQSGSYDMMTGTSPATAFAAAAAIVDLSLAPESTPQEIENQLKERAFSASSLILQMPLPGETVTVTDEAFVVISDSEDSDSDGVVDIIEHFHGSSYNDSSSHPAAISLHAASGSQISASFSIAGDLFDPENPFILTDGTTWKVWISDDLKAWEPAQGELTVEYSEDGNIQAHYTYEPGEQRGFLQIEVNGPIPE